MLTNNKKKKIWSAIYAAESLRFSPGDPSSYSRPDQVRTTHLHLELEADFISRVLHGRVVISLEKLDPNASSLILDARCEEFDNF